MSDLHDAIMSLDPPESASDFGDRLDERLDAAYKSGFQAARLAAAELVSAQPAAPAVCSSCDGTGKISGLPCAWCMQSAAPSVAPEPPRSAQLMICTGCGRQSDDEPIKTPSIACCPDNRYRTLRELLSEIDTLRRTHPPRAPLTEEQKRDLVKECDLDWHRGFMPLFDGDPTNRYAVLIEAVEAAHGIGGK